MRRIQTSLLSLGLLVLGASTASADVGLPLLLGKIWAIGYGLIALGVLLGLIPVCVPGRRKAPKKAER